MDEYIDRAELLEKLHELGGCDADPDTWEDGYDKAIDFAYNLVRGLPAADVEPVKHAKWIFKRQHHDADECNCSNCGQLMTTAHSVRMAYCPQCGFIMDGGADNG